MVKPAGPYLDVIAALRAASTLPIAAYHVSGEYAMLKAACLNGWLDERTVVMETLTGIRRAGADIIFTYYARQVGFAHISSSQPIYTRFSLSHLRFMNKSQTTTTTIIPRPPRPPPANIIIITTRQQQHHHHQHITTRQQHHHNITTITTHERRLLRQPAHMLTPPNQPPVANFPPLVTGCAMAH